MRLVSPFSKKLTAAVGVCTLVAGGAVASLAAASAASAATSPVTSRPANVVTADALPTAQINGVVWSQAVSGNTVYAGGSFSTARPAGSPAGVNTVPRTNLMSYDITTGVMTAFAPAINQQVRAVAVSPDGTRLYIGGDFTSVAGVARFRIAAFNTATGALVTTFAPSLDFKVTSLAVTNSTVYVGGGFSTASGVSRGKLAAFRASDGALTAWNPSADAQVNALVLTPDGSKVIAGGAFQNVGGQPAYGLAAIDAGTGALQPWAAGGVVRDAGTQAAILSLSTDGTAIYGTGYVFGSGGNLEGAFSADPNSGTLNWIEDCHGDTYGVFSSGSAVYSVSHAHYCGNIGGYPQSDPWSTNARHALAFTPAATGTIGHDPLGYYDFFGNPSPSLMNWFPDLVTGTFTGQSQAAWNVVGNSQYIALGGEFPSVNNAGQQGLVRFAVPSKAPNLQGPRLSGSAFVPNVISLSSGTARIAFPANWDRDDLSLTYKIIRDGNTAAPVYTKTVDSTYWNRPTIGFIDTGLVPGSTHKYRLQATDPTGNTVLGDNVAVTVSATGTISSYAQDVLDDGASHFWRLDESSGSASYDWAGYADLSMNSGVTRGVTGAINGDSDQASDFDGSSNGFGATSTAVDGPNTFSEEAWFKTSTTSGGKIIGFGNQNTGNSTNYDRHIYMSPDGKVWFGVYNNGAYTVNTTASYNDNQWHQVVATMSSSGPSSGLTLYVDGKRIGRNTGTSAAQPFSGYWRVGGDSPWNGNADFAGSIDDVAIYPTALTLAQVQKHFGDSGRSLPAGAAAPTDAYGKAVYADSPDVYYRMDDAAGPSSPDFSGNGNDATYFGNETFGVSSPVTGAAGKAVTFDGNEGSDLASGPVSNPTTYSEELWFKTTTTNGGKLIGFGSSQTGRSSSYDRHVYMEGSGQLTFGVWTGQTNTTTSAQSYNDGNWHYLVATQGSDGMKLYVDNALVGTNGQTTQQGYDGYWRIGGDTAWNGSAFFAGTIDEAAVYSTVLTPAQIAAHWNAASTVNHAPTAAFTSSATDLAASFDGSGSSDSDGTLSSYAWNFGDGATATGSTAQHTYAAAGTYSVTLTVTDNGGATGTLSKPITVSAANIAPTAAFTHTEANLTASLDASTSSDPDGTIASYAWDFGDGATGTGKSVQHSYAAAGTYSVSLTVTDNGGASGSVTSSVTVTAPPNVLPTASFTTSATGLKLTVDASASADPDGTIASYAWDFGDGGTATGVNASHSYLAAGSYPVTLTVTDNQGGTGTLSKPVTVSAAALYASDNFGRTTTNSLGSAQVGGAWTVVGNPALFSTNGAAGNLKLASAGAGPSAYLNAVSARDVNGVVDVATDSAPTGGGTILALAVRHAGSSDYRIRVRIQPTTTTLQLTKVVNGTETVLKAVTVPGLIYNVGDVLRLRIQASGSGSTTLSGKVWKVGASEPATWQLSTVDADPALQSAGGVGIWAYLSGTSTTVPVTASFDNLSVGSIPSP
jgi:PKD repeat protein